MKQRIALLALVCKIDLAVPLRRGRGMAGAFLAGLPNASSTLGE